MATITLNFKNKVNNYKTNFNAVNVIEFETSFINLKDYLKEDSEPTLIELKTQNVSHLNLSNVSPYVLIYFDDSKTFIGATHSVNTYQGDFSINCYNKYVLLMKIPYSINLSELHSLEINQKEN